jgi:hypothetical protein
MNQPTFPDGPPVPLMVEGVIDAATLRQMFADLAVGTEVLGVREKGDPVHYSHDAQPSLDGVPDRLLSGASRAVQVRYRYDGFEWTDTVVRTPTGFRVVRCRHD